MEEHTCGARLPHINGNVVRKQEISVDKGLAVPPEREVLARLDCQDTKPIIDL